MKPRSRREVFERVGRWFHEYERREVLDRLRLDGRAYYTMYVQIRGRLMMQTDAELRLLARAEEFTSSTNCGWTEYAVAETVAHEAKAILYARSRGL